MILDALLAFDTAYTFVAGTTGTVAAHDSTNIIDLGITSGIPSSASGGGARDIGIGDDPALKLLVLVTTTVTSGGAGTLALALNGAIDNGSGIPAAFSVWWTSPAYALATMNAVSRLYDMDMPPQPADSGASCPSVCSGERQSAGRPDNSLPAQNHLLGWVLWPSPCSYNWHRSDLYLRVSDQNHPCSANYYRWNYRR